MKSLDQKDPDENIIEYINYTKWFPDNLRTTSFISASFDEKDYLVTATEKFMIRRNSSDFTIYFMTDGMEFDVLPMYEIEKRMINSIKLFNN